MAFSDKILEKSIDPTVHQMLERAEQAASKPSGTAMKKCFPSAVSGNWGCACRNCNMGPAVSALSKMKGPKRESVGPQPTSS